MTFLQLLNYLPFRYARREVKMCRKYYNSTYTISHLYDARNGEYICDAIEDIVRDRNHDGCLDATEPKVYGETAIPCGRYYVTFRKTRLLIKEKAKDGLIPCLHKVPSFEYIRIHPGETEKNSHGCIILGYNKKQGHMLDSEKACLDFYSKMNYRPFWLEILDE